MMRNILGVVVAAMLAACPAIAHAQSMSGISVGDSIAVTRSLGTKPTSTEDSGPFMTQTWALANGNELMITSDRKSGEIMHVATTWKGSASGALSDVPGMVFGQTTLAEIRQRFGSAGFIYEARGPAAQIAQGHLVVFNSFELQGYPRLIVTFVTKIQPRIIRTGDFGAIATLETISFSDRKYLDAIWGEQKVYDHPYTKAFW